MEDHAQSDSPSQRAVAEINRIVEAVNAEISGRKSDDTDAAATKRNRRFVSAKAAQLSEVAAMARAAERQLAAAKTRVLNAVAEAEEAGFTVHEDWSVTNSTPDSPGGTTEAQNHAAAIHAAVKNLVALDEQVASRLNTAAKDLRDLRDN